MRHGPQSRARQGCGMFVRLPSTSLYTLAGDKSAGPVSSPQPFGTRSVPKLETNTEAARSGLAAWLVSIFAVNWLECS